MLDEQYTEEDLAGLSVAERAILQTLDRDESTDEELVAIIGDDDDVKPAAAKVEPGLDAAGQPVIADTDEDGDDTDAGLQFTPQTPADADATRANLETRKSEAFQKLMDGEIEAGEYQKVEKEVSGELEKLLQASITDNVTFTLTQAQINKTWQGEVNAIVKSAAAEGLDYKGGDLGSEFDGLIKAFASEAGTRGMTDEGLKASKWALAQAHTMMKVRHPGLIKTPLAVPGAKPVTKARAGADLSTIPPNLSAAPIAAGAAVADEFSHMEGLGGIALERAYARLSAEQQDRYMP